MAGAEPSTEQERAMALTVACVDPGQRRPTGPHTTVGPIGNCPCRSSRRPATRTRRSSSATGHAAGRRPPAGLGRAVPGADRRGCPTHARSRTSSPQWASSKPAPPTSGCPAAMCTSSRTSVAPADLGAPSASSTRRARRDLHDLVESRHHVTLSRDSGNCPVANMKPARWWP